MPASLRPCPTPLAPQWIRCLSLLVGLGWASWATIPFIGSAVPDGWVTTAGRGGASPLGQVLDGWVTWDRCCCPLAAFPLRLPPPCAACCCCLRRKTLAIYPVVLLYASIGWLALVKS